jgi:hypothetical protein
MKIALVETWCCCVMVLLYVLLHNAYTVCLFENKSASGCLSVFPHPFLYVHFPSCCCCCFCYCCCYTTTTATTTYLVLCCACNIVVPFSLRNFCLAVVCLLLAAKLNVTVIIWVNTLTLSVMYFCRLPWDYIYSMVLFHIVVNSYSSSIYRTCMCVTSKFSLNISKSKIRSHIHV